MSTATSASRLFPSPYAATDIAPGPLRDSPTVLARRGVSGAVTVDELPRRHPPDAVNDTVSQLLERR
jgi:hypothetical protein